MDNKNDNLPDGKTNYPYLKRNKTRCSEYDQRFTEFASLGEQTYFAMNQMNTKLTQLPGYLQTLDNKYRYGAYYRNFLQWEPIWRDQIPKLIDFQDEINYMKTYQVIVMIINILLCITVSIFLQISEIYNLLGKDVPCIPGEGDAEKKRILLIKRLFKYTFKIIQLPFIILALALSIKVKNFFGDLADSKVSDSTSNTVIDKVSKFVSNDVYSRNLNMLIFLLIMVVIDVIFEIRNKQLEAKKILELGKVQPGTNDPNPINNNAKQSNNNLVVAGDAGNQQPPD